MMEFADLFEICTERGVGSYKKRHDPKTKGLVGRFMYALVDGFTARFGGKLTLWDRRNKHRVEFGMDGESLVVDVDGEPALELTRDVLSVNAIEVESLTLYVADDQYSVQIGTDGILRAIKRQE